MNKNQQSIFEKAAGKVGQNGFEALLDSLKGSFPELRECPSVRICETRNELSLWFRQFAFACRAALPSPEP